MEFNLPTWTNTPETPITADALNEMVEAIRYLYDNRSQVGDIVCNSNLDTMEKVIERFGGTKWEQLKDTFLLGASDIHEVGTTGGDESNSHRHLSSMGTDNMSMYGTADFGTEVVDNVAGYFINPVSGTSSVRVAYTQSATVNNMPPYVSVYMWKRIE